MSPVEPPYTDPEDEVLLSEEQRAFIKKMLERLMELGIGVVYGEEEDTKDVVVDPGDRKELCRAVCCTFVFALTKEEVDKGIIKWNPKRPYFIAKGEDGYCIHLDRTSLMCTIWEDRPARCRKYDCGKDTNIWIDWEKKILNPNAFAHLAK